MPAVFPSAGNVLLRYVTGAGTYPSELSIRTPLGEIHPWVYSAHDVVTVVETFARVDYKIPVTARTVVDIGSNIGITALYFLTHSPNCRVHLYEPLAENALRLKRNLRDFAERIVLTTAAVSNISGRVSFAAEPTGRYGRITDHTNETVSVDCLHINDVLERVISIDGRIDVLKIDTEGHEERSILAASDRLIAQVGLIYIEARPVIQLRPELFDQSMDGSVCRLTRRASQVES